MGTSRLCEKTVTHLPMLKNVLLGLSAACISAADGEMPFTVRYFAIRGLGESVRMTLSELGLPFENHAVTKEEWTGGLKEEGTASGLFPFSQLPSMTHRAKDVSVVNLVQSVAIQNYLGRNFGLYGENDQQRARIDMVVGGVGDVKSRYGKLVYNQAAKTDPSLLKTFTEQDLPTWLGHFERLLSAGAPIEWFSGGSFSIADIMVFDMLESVLRLAPSCLDDLPLLQRFQRSVAARPGIAKWLSDPRRAEFSNGASAALDTPTNSPACSLNGAACIGSAKKSEL